MKFAVACIVMVTLCATRTTATMCYDSSDCGPSACCTLGGMQFPTPTCNNLRQEGDHCRSNNKPFNTNGTKPDGSFWYKATNVYDIICPCAPGLECREGLCGKRN